MTLWDKIKAAFAEPRSHSMPAIHGTDWPGTPEHVTKSGKRIANQYEINHWKVKLRQVLSKTVPHFGFGQCSSCGLPWWVVEGHTIMYTPSNGLFPVCESCWRDLGAEECFPFYVAHLEKWNPGNEQIIKQLRDAMFPESGFRMTMIPPDDKWWEKEE